MRLHLLELHAEKTQAKAIWSKPRKVWRDIDGLFNHLSIVYTLELIQKELISEYHDNLVAGHFRIGKTITDHLEVLLQYAKI